MAELQSCYFCGVVDDRLGEYGVVPESLLSDGEEQLTVVLCPTCHQKMTRVVQPIAERVADVAPEMDTDEEPSDAAGDDASVEPPSNNEIIDLADREEDETNEAADVDAGDGDGPDEAAADVDDDSASADEGADDEREDGSPEAEPSPSASSEPEGQTRRPRSDQPDVVFGVGGASADSTSGQASDASSPAAGDDPDEATESEDADDVAEPEGRESDDPGRSEAPEGYYQVLMLLQNREFPVNRADIEEVAVNAYELSHEECRRALDHAVDRGVVRERGGQLSLPGE